MSNMQVSLHNVRANGPGSATITCYSCEDFQRIANILKINDNITAKVRRKKSSGEKADIFEAKVKIKEIDYQTGVDEMLLRGVVAEDNEYVKAGAFQRINLRSGFEFTLEKNNWEEFEIEQLKQAADSSVTTQVVGVILHGQSGTICTINKKGPTAIKTISSRDSTFEKIGEFISKMDLTTLKCIVAVSQGNVAQNFIQFLSSKANRFGLTSLLKSGSFIEGKISRGDIGELAAFLHRPDISNKIKNIVESHLVQSMQLLMDMADAEPSKTVFGEKGVIVAIHLDAIDTMLVNEAYISAMDPKRRERFLNRKALLENSGSKVIIFPIDSEKSKDLEKIGNIAAILRFKIDSMF